MNNKITYLEFKEDLEKIVKTGAEPEIPFLLNGKKYMIIGFENMVSFQRFGDNEGDQSGEIFFKNLDELYNTETIDGILLKRDWKDIKRFDDHDLI